ncbi:hypothetical protein EBS02_08150, partial [bacterium]|nr:hypothetical protein [bacterium]
MNEEDLTSAPLDSTFGEGPQVDLGDISDVLKDSSIVDLSWLSTPISFKHEHSVHGDDVGIEWGDKDHPYGAFKLVRGNPSVREQIKKKSLWDHSIDKKNNLYSWAPPSISRVANLGMKLSSYQFFRRLMHRGYVGQNLAIEANKYIHNDEWQKTASVRKKLSTEQGILGNVYIDVTAFDSCHKAKEVTDKHNKLAKFVLETPHCGGCSYNSNGKCSLVSKRIASKNEALNSENTKKYLEYLKSVKRIDDNFISKNSSLSNQEILQRAFLSKSKSNLREAGVKATLPIQNDRKSFEKGPYVKIASDFLAQGYDATILKNKLAEAVPHQILDSVIKEAYINLESVPTSVDNCNSDILKNAKSLSRTDKCSGCRYDVSSHCGVNKTSFSSPKESSNRKISATFASLPMANLVSESLIDKATKAIENGNNYNSILKSASKLVGTKYAIKALDQAAVRAKYASPEQFESCDSSAFGLIASIK